MGIIVYGDENGLKKIMGGVNLDEERYGGKGYARIYNEK